MGSTNYELRLIGKEIPFVKIENIGEAITVKK